MQSSIPSPSANKQLLGDFRNFLTFLWEQLGLPAPTPVQYDIAEYLQNGPQRRMVKAFRGVGKSWITAAYALWRLKRNRNERILVLSGSSTKAREFTVFTRRLIEEIPYLHDLRPPMREGVRDSVESFDVAGSDPHQQPSVKSLGITSQLQGNRATVIIADDVETLRNSLTQTLRDRLWEMVKEFDSIYIPDTPYDIIYLGTDQNQMSLYKQLPARGYTVRVWPARVPSVDKLPAYGDSMAPMIRAMVGVQAEGTPTDPRRFHEEDLVGREASYGRTGFAMQFMLDPSLGDAYRYPLRCSDMVVLDVTPTYVPTKLAWGSDPKDQVIQDLECVGLQSDRYHRPMQVGDDWAKPHGSVMFVDPSGRGQDESSIAVVHNWGAYMYCTYVGGRQDGFDSSTLMWMAQTAKQQQVQLILVEPNYGGGMFNNLLMPVLQQVGYPCAVEDAPWAKVQKELRICDTLEPILNSHRLIITRQVIEQDLRDIQRHVDRVGEEHGPEYSLIHQLTRITRDRGAVRHEDRVEALAGACSYYVESMRLDEEHERVRHVEDKLNADIEEFLWDIAHPNDTGGYRRSSSRWATARSNEPAAVAPRRTVRQGRRR